MEPLSLTLFFTKGVSLATWASVGMLDRELALYRAMQQRGAQVHLVTYGGKTESRFHKQLTGMKLTFNRWSLPLDWYLRSLPISLKAEPGQIFKSNQVSGADVALSVARRKGAKFIARCGYLLSDFELRNYGAGAPEHQRAVSLERQVFEAADAIIVTTAKMRDQVLADYPIQENRISVIPNYVETERFAPTQRASRSMPTVGFVGRLDRQKNPQLLVQALADLDVDVEIIGEGPLRKELEKAASSTKARFHFLGNLPHSQLPARMAAWDIFVMTSRFEGHPKALIEAMSCALPVVATRVSGIKELIQHEVDGLLVEPETEALHAAVRGILSDQALRIKLGEAARARVLKDFALERVVDMELSLYAKLLDAHA